VPGNDNYAINLDTCVLIVGPEFGRVYLMQKLRKRGFRCKIYEHSLPEVWKIEALGMAFLRGDKQMS